MFGIVIHLKKVTSTMDIAKKVSYWLSPPFLVISDVQTSGYGQYNRKWLSPEGGLWLTEVLELKNYTALSLLMSILVVRVLEKYVSEEIVKIKWPNDVYLNGKKVAGILTKVSGNLSFVGIGINVENSVSGSLSNTATSLSYYTRVDRSQFLNKLLKEEDSLVSLYEQIGFRAFVKEYNKKLIFLNKQVVVKSKSVICGEAIGVDESGNLLINKGFSRVERISSGTVVSF